MSTKEPVRIFTAPGCEPCEEIKQAVEDGNLTLAGLPARVNIELVDLSTDEGYPNVDELNLEKVPVAYYEARQCKLLLDTESGELTIDCREDATEDSQEAPSREYPGPSPS
jgi:glutaredoxin